MKFLTVIVCFVAMPALAQQPPGPPPGDYAQAALAAEVMECIGGRVQLRQRVAQLEAELAKLKSDQSKGPPP